MHVSTPLHLKDPKVDNTVYICDNFVAFFVLGYCKDFEITYQGSVASIILGFTFDFMRNFKRKVLCNSGQIIWFSMNRYNFVNVVI